MGMDRHASLQEQIAGVPNFEPLRQYEFIDLQQKRGRGNPCVSAY